MDLCLGVSFKNIESPNPQKSSFGEVLEAFLGRPEVSWAVLARLESAWGVPWVRPGVPEGVLEVAWADFEGAWDHFGASLADFGGVWGSLGCFLGSFWKHLGPIWMLFC